MFPLGNVIWDPGFDSFGQLVSTGLLRGISWGRVTVEMTT
jgi:hypothetical protein